MKRKIFSVLFALVLAFSLAGFAAPASSPFVSEAAAQGATLEVWWEQLTSDAVNKEFRPAVSYDGSQIAYYKDTNEIWTMDADGSNQSKVADGQWAGWMPITEDLTYVNGNKLYQYVPAGSDKLLYTHPHGTGTPYITSFEWSPDESQVAITGCAAGHTIKDIIWLLDATDNYTASVLYNPSTSADYPTWSPDGSKVAFGSKAEGATKYIWSIDDDGTNLTQLTSSGNSTDPNWSPTLDKIIYEYNSQLWEVDGDGSNERQLTYQTDRRFMGKWSAGSTHLVIVRHGSAGRNIWAVSYPYPSIQSAINGADPGDTIIVHDGQYDGDLTISGLTDLTIKSVNGNASTTITGQSGVTINVQGGSNNFTFGGPSAGFTVNGTSGATTTFLFQITNGESGVTIEGNVFDTTGDASMGISVGAAGATDLTISNNTFVAGSGDGAVFGQDMVNVTVSDNTFTAASAPGYAVEFVGVTGTSTISGNTITGYGNGIFIFGASETAQAGTTGVSGLTISGNTVSGCVKGIRLGYVDQSEDMTTVTVTNNTITGNTTGLYVSDGTHVLASNFVIMYNSFVGNPGPITGLDNDNTEQVTAECNWWGDVAGPVHVNSDYCNPYQLWSKGDTVSGNVDYIPWLIHSELVADWNIWSTPIAPSDNCNTVDDALDLWGADSTKKLIAYYFDSSASPQAWAEATSLTPLEAIYLKMSVAGTIDVCFSTDYSSPPQRVMYTGWNLVGPAQLYDMDVDDALLDAYYGTGVATDLCGYSKVISPALNDIYWQYLRGGNAGFRDFVPTRGYWVYMVNQGGLAGSTSTPIIEVSCP